MDAIAAKASHARMLTDSVTVRRYSGLGTGRSYTEATDCRARVTSLSVEELVAGLKQGDIKVILYADDVSDKGLTSVLRSDKIIFDGVENTIVNLNGTRRVAGVLVAYELTARGGP